MSQWRTSMVLACWFVSTIIHGALGQLLDQAKPVGADLLGDPLPAGALARLGTTKFRPGGLVTKVTYSQDGKRLFSAAGNVIAWDAATGRELHRSPGFLKDDYPLTIPAISPDRKTLAVATGQGIELRDVAPGAKVRARLAFSGPLGGFAFARQGNHRSSR
jgi:hypothetical protein